LALVLVAGAAGGYFAFRDSDTDAPGGAAGTNTLLDFEPITDEPEEVWSWSTDDGVARAAAVKKNGDVVIAHTPTGGDTELLVASDGDAEERGTLEVDPEGFIGQLIDEDLLIAVGSGGEVEGFSLKDGESRFVLEDAHFEDDTEYGALVTSAGETMLMDSETGEERWRVPNTDQTGVEVRDDVTYLVSDGELRALDTETGEEDWTVETFASGEGTLEAAEDMVVLSDGSSVKGFDPRSGEELWSEDISNAMLDDLGLDTVVAVSTTTTTDDGGVEAIILRADGEQGRVPIDTSSATTEQGVSITTVRIDGDYYAAVPATRTIYDTDGEEAGSLESGIVLPTSDGYYVRDSMEQVTYYDGPGGEEAWRFDVPEGHRLDGIGSRMLITGDGSEVTVFE
ncbi:MAG: PQQ-binding-like beta-propeller repeat protein, partial [Nocardioides sp.]|nr:PQQ-binding-like beta-propeller repeat protein [Nocardioides sp.]